MLLTLPNELIRKIIFNLEVKDIYKILLTNTLLLNHNFQKFCLPQIYRNNFICVSENTNQLHLLIKDVVDTCDFKLNDYLNDLIDIVDSTIYYRNRDNNYSTFKRRFKTQRSVNFIYNKIDFNKKKEIRDVRIHDTYRVNYYTYNKLKEYHLNVLALIY